MLGKALAVISLPLFSANVLLVGAATRRLPQDLGLLLALASNVACTGVVVMAQYLLAESMPPLEWDALWFSPSGAADLPPRALVLLPVGDAIRATRALHVTNPVFAALAAWVLLGEALPPLALLCGSAVMAGVYLTSRPARRPEAAQALPGHSPCRGPRWGWRCSALLCTGWAT